MSLSQRTEMRRCGKRYGTEEMALRSKRVLAGAVLPVPCAYGCGGWHLQALSEVQRAAMRAQQRPQAVSTGPDAATRALVCLRDGYACVCCGEPVAGKRASLQHRKRRSQGGSNLPSNLVLMLGTGTTGCHARADSRVDPEDEAKGYTVRSHDDPRLVGVMYFEASGSGVQRWLEDDGGVLFESPAAVSR